MGSQSAATGEYRVFSQSRETTLDLAACDAHARRFFDATLTEGADDAQLILTAGGGPAVACSVRGRAVTAADREVAELAEQRMGGGGLAGLARRCPTIWEIACIAPREIAALHLAAILASVLLGPVVDPHGPEIFGVKTAREKLAREGASR